MRYRIDPYVKKRGKIEPEKKEDFEALGWHYVVTFREYHIFMADDPDVEELHTDYRVESFALKKLEKSIWGDFFQMLAIVVIPYLVSDFQRNELVSSFKYPNIFLTGENAAIIFVYLFVLIYLVKICLSLKQMRALRKALSEGTDYEYNKDSFEFRKTHKAWRILFWCMICLLFFTMFSSCHSVQDFDLPDTPRDIICLENLESGTVITEPEDYPAFLGGWIDDRLNPLLEENYQIFQRGLVEERTGNDQAVRVSLDAEYYKLRISGMAEKLYKEMVDRYVNTSPGVAALTSVTGTRLDTCVVANKVDEQFLVGIKGEEVICVTYNGNESLVENAAKIVNLMLDTSLLEP